MGIVVNARSADRGSLEVQIDHARFAHKRHERVIGAKPIDHRTLANEFPTYRISLIV